MAGSAAIPRAVGFVLVVLGLVALTAGPSLVEMSAITFIAGIPANVVDGEAPSADRAAGFDAGMAVTVEEGDEPGILLLTSSPPIPPRRAGVPERSPALSLLVLLVALVTLLGAPAAGGA